MAGLERKVRAIKHGSYDDTVVCHRITPTLDKTKDLIIASPCRTIACVQALGGLDSGLRLYSSRTMTGHQ